MADGFKNKSSRAPWNRLQPVKDGAVENKYADFLDLDWDNCEVCASPSPQAP